MLTLEQFIKAKQPKNLSGEIRLLSFDPGETIGWASFEPDYEDGPISLPKKEFFGQIRTTEFTLEQLEGLEELIIDRDPTHIVYESYRIYSWMTETHAWDEVHTAQIIGIIKFLALKHKIPVIAQTAQIAKQFCTNEKLESWKLYQKGQKHALDAIRHGCYALIFNPLHESL